MNALPQTECLASANLFQQLKSACADLRVSEREAARLIVELRKLGESFRAIADAIEDHHSLGWVHAMYVWATERNYEGAPFAGQGPKKRSVTLNTDADNVVDLASRRGQPEKRTGQDGKARKLPKLVEQRQAPALNAEDEEVCSFLLKRRPKMSEAGLIQARIILASGKWEGHP